MAKKWCLTLQAEAKLLEELKKDGNPQKMVDRGTDGRIAWFTERVGEFNATKLNEFFEQRLLLKSQKRGLDGFIKNLRGSDILKKQLKADIENIKKPLNPFDLEKKLGLYVDKALGFETSETEFKQLVTLAKDIQEKGFEANIDNFKKMSAKEGVQYLRKETPKQRETRKDYGRSVIAFENYKAELKFKAEQTTLKEKIKDPIRTAGKGIKTIMNSTKASSASLDNSALLNQGFSVLANVLTAKTWFKNGLKTWVDMAQTLGGKAVWDEVRADIVSRPNYINGVYNAAKLAVNVTEEDFPNNPIEKVLNLPTTLIEKGTKGIIRPLPILKLGSYYKATEVAFSAFQLRNRADVFDIFAGIQEKLSNEKLTIENVKKTGLGDLVNSITSRGNLGKFEPIGNLINAPFFSLRRQKSIWDSIFGYQKFKGQSKTVRVLGAFAMLQQIALIGILLAIAKALKPDSVKLDPRSSDFGKIKYGNSRFDITQGRSSWLTLAARLITGQSKSSLTGKITEYNTSAYGSQDKTDLLGTFTENKLSPFFTQAIAVLNEKDKYNNDKKPTIVSVVSGLYKPLSVDSFMEARKDPKAANQVAVAISDFLGVPVNTYGTRSTDWNQKTSKEMIQLKDKIGQTEFDKANAKYNKLYDNWFSNKITDPELKKLSDDDKDFIIDKVKEDIKLKVFKEYKFKPKDEKRSKSELKKLNKLTK